MRFAQKSEGNETILKEETKSQNRQGRELSQRRKVLSGELQRERLVQRSEGFRWAYGRRSSRVIQALFRIPLLMSATGDNGVIVQAGAVSVDA